MPDDPGWLARAYEKMQQALSRLGGGTPAEPSTQDTGGAEPWNDPSLARTTIPRVDPEALRLGTLPDPLDMAPPYRFSAVDPVEEARQLEKRRTITNMLTGALGKVASGSK